MRVFLVWFGLVWCALGGFFCLVGLVGLGFGFFQDSVSLCSSGCPGSYSVDQAVLYLSSAGIKKCALPPPSPHGQMYVS